MKIIWSMTHIMQEDARRRFVIAFTIENTDMRLWLATRSEVLVSLPFNWIEVRPSFHQRFLTANATCIRTTPSLPKYFFV